MATNSTNSATPAKKPLLSEEQRATIFQKVADDKDVRDAARRLEDIMRRTNCSSGNAKEDKEMASALTSEQRIWAETVKDEVAQRVAPKGTKNLTDAQKTEIALIQERVMTKLGEGIADASFTTCPNVKAPKGKGL